MGMYHTTYVVYGVRVPEDRYSAHVWEESDRLGEVIEALGSRADGVEYLSAGDYDDDRLFLCWGRAKRVDLGDFMKLDVQLVYAAQWDEAIALTADAAGYGELGHPTWLVVSDVH